MGTKKAQKIPSIIIIRNYECEEDKAMEDSLRVVYAPWINLQYNEVNNGKSESWDEKSGCNNPSINC